MTVIDEQGRPEPPVAANEVDTLLGFLDFQRATLEWKCRGLDREGLQTRVAVSSITLGGLLKHLALVEDYWFTRRLLGRPTSLPWASVDWDADPDWEWSTAGDHGPDELFTLWSENVERSRAHTAEALADGGLDRLAVEAWSNGESPSLRWILVHMIEEYARHNGHADLIREAVDGEVGE